MTFRKRVFSFLCAACVMLSLWPVVRPIRSYASTLSDQLDEARQEQAELESKIEAIRADKDKVVEQKALLDQRNEQLRKEISLIEQQSGETQARITELTAQEEEQYALFCSQVREEEERGTVSYWSVIFKSTGFADLLARMDFVNEIMDHDRQVIQQLQDTRRQLTEDKAALEQQKTELVSTRQELQSQITAASALISEYEQSEAGHQEMLDQAAEDEVRIQELIRKQQQQQQQQQQKPNNGNSNSGSNSSANGYIWPTNATRLVSSPYGWRNCPYHGREFHNGSDIAASWGTAVLAANSGTVIQAGWNGGYGISVYVDCGDGMVIRYGHLSETSVEVGQTVAQGDLLGLSGNTGNSTGPHLHFEMRVNDEVVDPLEYVKLQ